MHGGSFFLFFHPDDESSEKKTFAKNGYGSTVSYPTIHDYHDDTNCVIIKLTLDHFSQYNDSVR